MIYFGYDKNLQNFTLGQGGYFSPQQYYALLFPISLKQQVTPDVVVNLGGSIGVQSYHTKSSDIFPSDPALENQLIQASATTPGGVATRYSGNRFTGIAGGAHADIDYRVTSNLHIGASAGFDRSGDFTEGTGLVYARYVFNDPQ